MPWGDRCLGAALSPKIDLVLRIPHSGMDSCFSAKKILRETALLFSIFKEAPFHEKLNIFKQSLLS